MEYFYKSPTFYDKFEGVGGKSSGFDYLRLILSISVVLIHTKLVNIGPIEKDPIYDIMPTRAFTFFVLPAFFALSGFLVAGSLNRQKTLFGFLSLRAIRIFPALIFDIVLWALLFGPLLTNLTLSEYFTTKQFYTYLLNIIGWVHYFLPGVFTENPFPSVINQQLWTIPYELECYIALSLLALFGLMKNKWILVLIVAIGSIAPYLILLIKNSPDLIKHTAQGRLLVLCFLSGVVFHFYQSKIKYNIVYLIIAFTLYVLFCKGDAMSYLTAIPITYITIYIGCLNIPRVDLFLKHDVSYGIYLYGFPVQQFISMLLPAHREWYVNFFLSMPLIISLALISMFFIEAPLGKNKRQIVTKMQEYFDYTLRAFKQKV